MQRLTLTIPNMHCANCVMTLEGLEDELPGIEFIQASYKTQKMVVEYNESLVSEAQIRQAVNDLGYEIA